jgi:mono/diheme cytochrome c family protein
MTLSGLTLRWDVDTLARLKNCGVFQRRRVRGSVGHGSQVAMTSVWQRFSLLLAVAFVVVVASACGRATQEEINQALGITPTPTPAEEKLAAASETASGPGTAAPTAGSAGAVALGDVTKGKRQFGTWCAGCHGPGGSGPDIRSPGSAGSTITVESLMSLVRDGTGHPTRGPFKPTEISDSQVADIAAYLQSEAAS